MIFGASGQNRLRRIHGTTDSLDFQANPHFRGLGEHSFFLRFLYIFHLFSVSFPSIFYRFSV